MRIKSALSTLLLATGLLSNTLVAERYYLDSPFRFSFFGEYLFLQVAQDQMQYAAVLPGGIARIANSVNDASAFFLNPELKIEEPCYNYSSGFRVGIGFREPCLTWDFSLEWTSLHRKQHDGIKDSDFGVIPIVLPVPSIVAIITGGGDDQIPNFAQEAKSCWKFEFNTLDFEIGRRFTCFNQGLFRPFVGVKGVSIRQNQDLSFIGLEVNRAPLGLKLMRKNNFYGIGPSFGIDSSWGFCSGFCLSSGLTGALLYGNFDVFAKPYVSVLTDEISSPTQSQIVFDITQNKHDRIRPTVNGYISLDFAHELCGCMAFNMGVGYEVHYFWNQWQPTTTALAGALLGGASPQGDLSLQGLRVHLDFSF